MKILFTVLCLLVVLSCSTKKSISELQSKINEIISGKNAAYGIGVYHFESKEALYINGDKPFVMMSVVKFPQAVAILHQVDEGKLDYEMDIHFEKSDLRPDTYSPVMNVKKTDTFDIPLVEALSYTVSMSDNNVCDKLFKILGSTNVAEGYLRGLGLIDITIGTDYANMQENTMYANQSTPKDMIDLLRLFYTKKILSEKSTEILWEKLVETSTGPDRLKGLLPEGTVVGHKTGTSGTDDEGVTAAYNDVGIVKLPNGESLALVVFIADSKETDETNANTIAEISKAAYECFVND